jgi:hypothetical protein
MSLARLRYDLPLVESMILVDLVLTEYLLRSEGIDTEVPESRDATQDESSGPDFDAAVAAFLAIGALTPDQAERCASIETTERAYGHLEESYMRGAAERVEDAIWEGRLEIPGAAPRETEGD